MVLALILGALLAFLSIGIILTLVFVTRSRLASPQDTSTTPLATPASSLSPETPTSIGLTASSVSPTAPTTVDPTAPTAVSPTATNKPTAPATWFSFVGIDNRGNDLPNGYTVGTIQSACQASCASNPSCGSFVMSPQGECWLKDGSVTPNWTSDINKTMYTTSTTANPFTPMNNFDTAGNDISEMDGTPHDCAIRCGATPNCQFFITNSDSNHCWLKSAAGTTTTSSNRNMYLRPGQAFNPIATLYDNVNYSGASASMVPGDYPVMFGFLNDKVSSVALPPGYGMTLWENGNFGGKSLALTASEPNLVNRKFNDMASSYKYYKL